MNEDQKAQVEEFLRTIRSVRGFDAQYEIRESADDIRFTSGVKPVIGAVYLWIAAAPDGSHGEFPPIAFSPPEGAVSMPSIRTYVREQLTPANGLLDVVGARASRALSSVIVIFNSRDRANGGSVDNLSK